ncbi:MAG: helix-turn-helix transcriptional regulator [Caldimonas sp.]
MRTPPNSGRRYLQPHASELWQRLRAGRELARKTHADVAIAVGLTHTNAVASWEATDPSGRAQPLMQQVLRVARLCGLPAYLLIDDAVSLEDIRSFKRL